MTAAGISLNELSGNRLSDLCDIVRLGSPTAPKRIVAALLGAAGSQPVGAGPMWPSNVGDDGSPIEFSVAFDGDGVPTLRVLAETTSATPGVGANAAAAERVLRSLGAAHGLSFDKLDRIRDVLLPDEPAGRFGLWTSVIFRRGAAPDFKVYLDPDAAGPEQAWPRVARALARLGRSDAAELIARHALRRGALDHPTFFALDLHHRRDARVKVYVSHHDADISVAQEAARVSPATDPADLAEFHRQLAGDVERCPGRPLLSSYSFTRSGLVDYTLYLPIRQVVADDEHARDRLFNLMAERNLDTGTLRRALDAVADRPLRDGVGLIAYVSLRTGPANPGITVYLSAEAYGVTPPGDRADHCARVSRMA